MAHEAEIRTHHGTVEAAIEPESIVVRHHRVGVAEMKVTELTGGRLLHLALAGCVFNNVNRLARDRGIALTDASVRVSGDFTSDGASTGIDCTVDIKGDTESDELQKLAQDAFDDSTVVLVLKRATTVTLVPPHEWGGATYLWLLGV